MLFFVEFFIKLNQLCFWVVIETLFELFLSEEAIFIFITVLEGVDVERFELSPLLNVDKIVFV
jgi:hypothetical protein